jgi:hypothetical protein
MDDGCAGDRCARERSSEKARDLAGLSSAEAAGVGDAGAPRQGVVFVWCAVSCCLVSFVEGTIGWPFR